MSTFVQFYIVMLGFVNFRLYHTLNLVYPPKFSTHFGKLFLDIIKLLHENLHVKSQNHFELLFLSSNYEINDCYTD